MTFDIGADVVISDLPEINEILKSRSFVHDAHPDALAFVAGTINYMHGEEHLRRRRLLTSLFDDEHVLAIEQNILPVAIGRSLSELTEGNDQDGYARVDLVQLAENIFWRVIAQVIGLDGVDDRGGPERLQQFLDPIINGVLVRWLVADADSVIDRAHEAKSQFAREFVIPSCRRRQQLCVAVQRGEADPSALPDDLLTRLIRSGGSEDEDALVREACTFLVAGTVNNTSKLIFCLEYLEDWLGEHAEDRERRTDPVFLKAAFEEALRMRGASARYTTRIALENVTLRCTGRFIPVGQLIALDLPAANQDIAFGKSPDRFNPHRSRQLARNTTPSGVSFGAGPHVCLGKPLVVGSPRANGPAGIMPEVIRRLILAGMEFAAEGARAVPLASVHRYEYFPVRFPQGANLESR